jgi:hypothetical protein
MLYLASDIEDKKMKKWDKMINKAFEQKINYEEESLYEKMEEKFQTDQDIKNIINELYIKIKNCDYFVKKQWFTLKKYNLQEKIHMEESQIIENNEKIKLNQIYQDAILKLAACHMIGFEPISIIRKKILSKIQIKYNINEENMKELENHFNSNEDDDERLNDKRHENQIEVLKKIISDSSKFNYREVDKNTYLNTKAEIKKYEKDLELKAIQNEIVEEKIDAISKFENNEADVEKKENSEINSIESEINSDNNDDSKIKITQIFKNNFNKIEFEDELINEMNNDSININDDNNISKFKQFNSQILNDLEWKLKTYGKLTDFDMQIILYISHSVSNELINAKNKKIDYNLSIHPTELLKFFKMFQIDLNSIEKNKLLDEHSSPSPNELVLNNN